MANLHTLSPRLARRLALVSALLLPLPAAAACPALSTISDHVFGGGLCLAAETLGAEQAGATPTLVVVVHGDISDGGAATYHAEFARTLARPGVVAVALIR